jgi:hypothetical protein
MHLELASELKGSQREVEAAAQYRHAVASCRDGLRLSAGQGENAKKAKEGLAWLESLGYR